MMNCAKIGHTQSQRHILKIGHLQLCALEFMVNVAHFWFARLYLEEKVFLLQDHVTDR